MDLYFNQIFFSLPVKLDNRF